MRRLTFAERAKLFEPKNIISKEKKSRLTKLRIKHLQEKQNIQILKKCSQNIRIVNLIQQKNKN